MKRRKFTAKFKIEVVLEAIKKQKTLTQIAQQYTITPTQISKWRKEFLLGAENAFSKDSKNNQSESDTSRDALFKTIEELKEENDFLKKKIH